ncbi:hypothetical protein J500_0791 [Acinetobacter sp. 479375]|nr:hypothetical protein J500_0791 [Acinetobacter sp. 479375]
MIKKSRHIDKKFLLHLSFLNERPTTPFGFLMLKLESLDMS